MAPPLAEMRRLDDRGDLAEPAHGRREQAAVEEVRVEDVDPARPEEPREPGGGGDVPRPSEAAGG